MSLTHYPESMSGPREPMVSVECAICRAESEVGCNYCGESVCRECIVECAGCTDDANPMCISCAVKRRAFEKVGDEWLCENCQGEYESQIEEAKR